MADWQTLTPWFLGLIATAIGWLFKSVIQLGKDVIAIQTAFKFYVDNKAKGAAMVLDSPNPTPEDMRKLLRRYYDGSATKPELKILQGWLADLVENPTALKAERSAAIDVLSGMGAMKILDRQKSTHGHR